MVALRETHRHRPLVDVTTSVWDLEYSIHECPHAHKGEVAAIFPGVDTEGILVVPTCQHAKVDLVRTGDQVEGEKDRLLERFMEWSKAVTERLQQEGHWADYIDPCSGLPMVHKNGMTTYGEVDGLATLLGYKTANAGCCKILLHPRWGSAVYPASLFTRAPAESLIQAIQAAEQHLRARLDTP